MSDKQPPVDRVRLYPVTVAIWRNTSKEGDPFYGVTTSRSYKDDAGNYKDTDNLNHSDLLLAAEALRLAYHKINKLRAADRAAKGATANIGEEDDSIAF